MKKRAELLQKINASRKIVLDFLKDGKINEAKAESDNLEKLMKDFDELPNEGRKVVDSKMDKKQKLFKAVNNYLHKGWAGMDEEDRNYVKVVDATGSPAQVETTTNPSRGSVFVPFEVADFTEFIATGVYRLRTRVQDYVARTLSGRIPLANNPTSGLVEMFDEYPESGITKKDVKFGAIDWTVRPYGAIVPVSNQLLEDANQDVLSIIAEIFFRAQVITENNMILAALDSAGEAVEASSWKDVVKALNGISPVGSADKVLITNTDGWNELDTATDKNGFPIMVPMLQDATRRQIKGYEVIQLPNEVLATDAVSGAIPMYAVSLKDACVFIERRGLELFYNPYSDNAMTKDATDIRVTCRMAAALKYASAVKKLAYTPEEEEEGEG